MKKNISLFIILGFIIALIGGGLGSYITASTLTHQYSSSALPNETDEKIENV